jgi:hypothetical protein
MSHSIKNPRTKSHLDQLAKRRKIQQQIRELKAENIMQDYDIYDHYEN